MKEVGKEGKIKKKEKERKTKSSIYSHAVLEPMRLSFRGSPKRGYVTKRTEKGYGPQNVGQDWK